MTDTFLNLIWNTSESIKDGRSRYKILAKAVEEIGELSQEVMIVEGDHYKEPGKDGVIGEAVDLMICGADMIYKENPNISEEQILEIVKNKLSKWKTNGI